MNSGPLACQANTLPIELPRPVAMYIRQSFYQYCTLIEKDSDDIIWIRIKGRLLNLSHDLYLCLCYIIPSSSSREALVEMDVLDRITDLYLK